MSTDNLVARARNLAALRARADGATAEMDQADADLRAAIIDAVRDVLPLLCQRLGHAPPGMTEGIPVRFLAEQRIGWALDHHGHVHRWPGNERRTMPYALEIAEALSDAIDSQIRRSERTEPWALARAEDLRVVTRMIRGAFGKAG